jgi:hypothetical protein
MTTSLRLGLCVPYKGTFSLRSTVKQIARTLVGIVFNSRLNILEDSHTFAVIVITATPHPPQLRITANMSSCPSSLYLAKSFFSLGLLSP